MCVLYFPDDVVTGTLRCRLAFGYSPERATFAVCLWSYSCCRCTERRRYVIPRRDIWRRILSGGQGFVLASFFLVESTSDVSTRQKNRGEVFKVRVIWLILGRAAGRQWLVYFTINNRCLQKSQP
ncbi:hypothetical protein CEXT_49341 [Caerostris extrusa]|uniref:Uncharacterized protein n=1 Tax=Caerostris extrusa TaxID=172846 RepID=A0AAV4XMF7_CAEEX|nr:hypothetical protein CEXT_49341 [Caerostris extrusa]